MRRISFLQWMGIAACLTTALPAKAGLPECGNIRFEGLSNCEVQVTANCNASCSKFGIYETACATKLVPVCSQQCTLSATPMCSDKCNTQCKSDCDNGVNVICAHNCFAECTTERDTKCASDTNPSQCAATWNANCDAQCDSKCVTVDGGCYQHCIECCDGSCTADANMDCQNVCQDQLIKDCEHEFQADCSASCTGDGALFCNGEYIISGSQLQTCLKALAAQGIQVKAEAKVTIGPDGINGGITGGLCSYSPASKGTLAAPFAALAMAAGWFARRRKRDSRTSS
jgi:hypothetical protein